MLLMDDLSTFEHGVREPSVMENWRHVATIDQGGYLLRSRIVAYFQCTKSDCACAGSAQDRGEL